MHRGIAESWPYSRLHKALRGAQKKRRATTNPPQYIRMQDAGGDEYPSNEQHTNMKWFCNLSHGAGTDRTGESAN